MVDVKDLASAHIVPLIDPFLLGNNGRYLISTDGIWYNDIITILNDHRHEIGIHRLKHRQMSTFKISFAALFINKRLKEVLPFVN